MVEPPAQQQLPVASWTERPIGPKGLAYPVFRQDFLDAQLTPAVELSCPTGRRRRPGVGTPHAVETDETVGEQGA